MSSSITVVLDLDGTLINTSPRHYVVYRTIVHQFGITPLPFNAYWKTRRQGLSNLDVLKENGLSSRHEALAAEMWLTNIESLEMLKQDQVFPGGMLWLEINQANVGFVLVTLRSHPDNLFNQLDWLGLTPFFKNVLVVPHQPKPHCAKANAVKTTIDANILIWIGDSEVDMLAAKLLSVPAIGVNSGMRSASKLKSAGARWLFDKITQINLLNLALGETNP